jgi:hypothetical protein
MGQFVNSLLERIGKEAAVYSFGYYPDIILEGIRKVAK